MKTLYIDAFSGVSGDKMAAALLELTEGYDYLFDMLKTLRIDDEYTLSFTQKNVMGIESTYFNVSLTSEKGNKEHEHHNGNNHSHDHIHTHHDQIHHVNEETHHKHIHRNLSDITKIINNSDINDNAKEISLGIFRIIAEAEAKVHGKSIDDVHFHEVGATDSIIDIVSAGVLIDLLKIDNVISSPIPTGFGFINASHGKLPVPAPATAEILKGIPTYQGKTEGELTTPTGAAIIKYLAKNFGGQPDMIVDKIGYGAGTKEFEIPNVLRLFLGETKSDRNSDIVIELKANIDDSTPEQIGFLCDRLYKENAIDVFLTPVVMKKNRQGTLVTVLCYETDREKIEKTIFLNSTTFGIRRTECNRTILERDFKTLEIEGIEVKIKRGYLEDRLITESIEYEDLKKLSEKQNISYNEASKIINKALLSKD